MEEDEGHNGRMNAMITLLLADCLVMHKSINPWIIFLSTHSITTIEILPSYTPHETKSL